MSSHGFFDDEKIINNLSQMYGNKCYFDLLNITSIILKRDRILENSDIEIKLKKCGYKVKTNNAVRNILYRSNGIKINKIIELKSDKKIISSIDSGTIILSKVY